MKVLFLSASSTAGHTGCDLVDEAFLHQFDKFGMEVVKTIYKTDLPLHHTHRKFYIREMDDLPDFDLVVVNAEGATHHSHWPSFIQVAEDYPSVLVNAVWQQNSYKHDLSNFLYTSARETISRALMLPTTQVVPDIILAAPTLHKAWETKGYTATYNANHNTTCCVVRDDSFDPDIRIHESGFLESVASSTRLSTGRFHGALIAASLRVPFTAWPSNTHKTLGLMQDMGLEHNFYNTRQEAIAAVPTGSAVEYIEAAPRLIDGMFEDILSLT